VYLTPPFAISGKGCCTNFGVKSRSWRRIVTRNFWVVWRGAVSLYNEPFDFVTDPDRDPDPGILNGISTASGIERNVRDRVDQLPRRRFAVSECFWSYWSLPPIQTDDSILARIYLVRQVEPLSAANTVNCRSRIQNMMRRRFNPDSASWSALQLLVRKLSTEKKLLLSQSITLWVVLPTENCLKRWLQLRFDFDSTAVRLLFRTEHVSH